MSVSEKLRENEYGTVLQQFQILYHQKPFQLY